VTSEGTYFLKFITWPATLPMAYYEYFELVIECPITIIHQKILNLRNSIIFFLYK